jgi:putative membrane protein
MRESVNSGNWRLALGISRLSGKQGQRIGCEVNRAFLTRLWNNAAVIIFILGVSGNPVVENSNRARDHLANERTFLAWVRTSVAVVVFGFANWAVCDRNEAADGISGTLLETTGLSVWMGMSAILAGVVMMVAGLARYRRTRTQLDDGKFEPAGLVVDLVAILTVLFGLALAGYLIYVQKSLG